MYISGHHKPKILIADDQPDVLTALRLLLKSEGFETQTAKSPTEVVCNLETGRFDAVLIDMNYRRGTTSGEEGLQLVAKIAEAWPQLPLIAMTAWASIDLAVDAVRRGATDFLQKPWDNQRLLAVLRAQLDLAQAAAPARNPHATGLSQGAGLPSGLIAASKAMQEVMEQVRCLRRSDVSVLITGENGTGKGVVAREVHAQSRRCNRPLVTVNIGALPEMLFESELFGHVAGAFTDARQNRQGRFELADGATLFMDEIGNLPLACQAKLLRAIETGEFEPVGSSETRRVNIRLLAATNSDLRERVRSKSFREDLYYRMNTIEIHLPPLRERKEDILPMVNFFLTKFAERYDCKDLEFSAEAIDAVEKYHWPGNVRQLEHCLERAVLLAHTNVITVQDLALSKQSDSTRPLDEMTLDEVEHTLIRKALVRSAGKMNEAAASLGLSRSALYRRLVKYGFAREGTSDYH